MLMRLYLVQHGEAKKVEEDPLRPLSEKGREDIQRVAKYAEKLDIKEAVQQLPRNR